MITLAPEATEIDPATSPHLTAQISEVAAEEDLVLDLSQVTFMDSTGLRALLMAHVRQWSAGGTLTLLNPSPQVLRVIRITGLDTKLDIT